MGGWELGIGAETSSQTLSHVQIVRMTLREAASRLTIFHQFVLLEHRHIDRQGTAALSPDDPRSKKTSR